MMALMTISMMIGGLKNDIGDDGDNGDISFETYDKDGFDNDK